jgi:hypothetical protein
MTKTGESEMTNAKCKEAGPDIDPATAEVTWGYVRHFHQVQREYLARGPGGDWVEINDLPAAIRDVLMAKLEKLEKDDQLDWMMTGLG